jgi:GntR family transcriptional regulator
MVVIDRGGPVPIYYQLKQLIRQKIEAGEWQPGQIIPSERELCAEHGISRMTVRQALVELVNEGWLRREQGKGTFVAHRKIEQRLATLTSFSQDMAARGKQSEAKVLRQELAPASADVAAALGLAEGTPVLLVERLRLANGEPLAVETCHLYFPDCGDLMNEDLAGQSLYAVLARNYGLVPDRATQQIEAAICEPRPMRLLGLPRGAAVLLIHRTTLNQAGVPFEHTISIYRGDKYVFHAELTRS